MPKFKGRTTRRGEWSEENTKRAIQDVLDRKMSQTAAAERHEAPRNSLQDRVNAVKQCQQIIRKPILGRFQQTFAAEYKRQLCRHVTGLDNRLIPLTTSAFLCFAYDLAGKSNIDHRFNKENDGWEGFIFVFEEEKSRSGVENSEATSLMQQQDSITSS